MIPGDLLPVATHIWQSTLVAVLAAALTLLFQNNHAAIRHWIWMAASVKFLIPFSVLAAVGSHLAENLPPPPRPPQMVSFVELGSSIAFPPPAAFTPAVEGRDGAPAELIVLTWLVGACVVAIRWVLAWHWTKNVVRDAAPLKLGLPVPVVSSQHRLSPSVAGVFRPVVLLPAGIEARLTPLQFRSVLVHELCHIRRKDNFLACFQMSVETLFWFHPLVWWIGRRLVDERERACDEEVLRVLNQPQAYAEGVLAICRFFKEEPLGNVSQITQSNLQRRIRQIMAAPEIAKLGIAKRVVLTGAAAAFIGLPVIAGVGNVGTVQAQSPSVPRQVHAMAAPRPVKAAPAIAPKTNSVRAVTPAPARTAAQNVPAVTPASAAETAASSSDYIFGAGDELTVHVWREPELTQSVVVRPDGKISMPLLNDIQAAGLTASQLTETVQTRLQKYLADPVVAVIVTKVRNATVTIIGSIKTPGMVALSGPMTVVQLIAAAGGFTEFARTNEIQIQRKNGPVTMRYIFNYRAYTEGNSSEVDLPLRLGDIIIVP